MVDVENLVLLKSGDLLTGQHIRSLMESRSEESTPWRRLQHVVFVMGLFHLKMACTDALWRLFIHPKLAKEDPCSLIKLVSQIRPKETGKIESKPAYRQMHEVIQHVGIVLRLDAWRIIASERIDQSVDSLEAFAGMKPTWEVLVDLSHHLCRNYVTNTHELSDMRRKPTGIRDHQHENVLIQHQYFLLYEEISYAMNYGDIGRIETLFLPWIWIFRSCGKHKYATEMRRYLENVHFIYPKGLSKAIRKNILCNPTGKEGAFRAIDWLVELNNLFTKHTHGGSYSNQEKNRIIEESLLIEVYRSVRVQLERMFGLDHRTTRHSLPDMTATFMKLAVYMKKENTNKFMRGRKTNYNIPDAISKGMNTMVTEGRGETALTTEEEEDWQGLDDEFAVEDEGDLSAI
ncbi:hypothetical protein M378DRAFT_92369 [Amanita muscaria Koide BX008]|uniref:DUF6589 domain-containing protein n=1 Tax=Amanita muscaria (strain Koide BX008) TaxID=946122 RepID=A0A0C2VZY4_AMAMK|nr:hypothetical protein M378DRAFT_92613 [Amanita muscaria Koide BX008]KIL54530.1 hypothetical protein M378DRAFT_92369 [Amanita muscaria Koide BX008]